MVTAILLLLSLPVLAGIVYIILFMVPALNLAVSRELLHSKQKQGPSGGNVQDFMPVQNLNDCAPEPLTNNRKTLGSYLAGLIEGDGTIVVPRIEPKGKLNYASVQIVFQAKDFPMLTLLAKTLDHGSISKKKMSAAYIYTINNFAGLQSLVNLINGSIRTPKIMDFQELINYINQKNREENLILRPLNTSPLISDA